MTIPIKLTCPLGADCEKIVDGAIHRCRWYKCLAGTDPQTGEPINDVWDCSLSWLPLLLIENAMTGRSIAAATESFRNEVVKGTEVTNTILLTATQQSQRKITDK